MKHIIISALLLFSCELYAQVKMDQHWRDIFKIDERAKEMEVELDGEQTLEEEAWNVYKTLENQVIKNRLGKTNLKFGLEILRVDENHEEIKLRKSQYPLPEINETLIESNLITKTNIDMYAGLFAIPILSLNLEKDFLASLNENQKESEVLYGLIVIPLKEGKNIYTFRVTLVAYLKLLGNIVLPYGGSMDLTMHVGEKMKILIDPTKFNRSINIDNVSGVKVSPSILGMGGPGGHAYSISSDEKGNWTVFSTVNRQTIKFSSCDEFFQGIKDYLVLSFESDN